jgi:hypothetical protein
MKWLKSFRQFVIYTVSLSLAWPANAYAMSKDSFTEIKALIETSELAKREVSLQEFYSKNIAAFPTFLRIEIENILAQDPQAKMPKIQVTKLKGDDVQISFVWGGKSQSLILMDNEKGFAKMGDVVFSREDLYNHGQMIKKLEMASQIKEDQWRSVPKAFSKDYHILSARQIAELTIADRQQYIKDIRNLMDAVEKVRNEKLGQQKPVKTSSYEVDQFWGLILERAQASWSYVGQPCMVAGFPSRTDSVKTGRDAGKIVCSFERVPERANSCGYGQISCNPAFYGTSESGQNFCVSQKNDATSQCNFKSADSVRKMASEFNPDKSGRVASQWDSDRQAIENELARAIETCRANASSLVEPARGGLKADQDATCGELEKRLQRITTYSCEPANVSNAFFEAYKDWCTPTRQAGNTGHDQTPPADCTDHQSGGKVGADSGRSILLPANCVQANPANPQGGTKLCSQLPVGYFKQGDGASFGCNVPGGASEVAATEEGYTVCAENNTTYPVAKCTCVSGSLATLTGGKYNCSGEAASTGAGSSGASPSKKKCEWCKWALVIGGGIFMFWAANALTKQWTRDFVRANVPNTPNPPITVPPTPTIPRGAR